LIITPSSNRFTAADDQRGKRVADKPKEKAMSEFLSDVKYLRLRARQRLEQGPVTDGYKVGARKVIAVVALLLAASASAGAQRHGSEATVARREVTIQITVHPHNDRARAAAAQFQADDFTVREEKRLQRIISVKHPDEAPPILAVLIQDDLVSRVNNEIKGVKEFIRRLPEGSRVMTGYITSGSFRVAQDFTPDLALAADSLRILRSSESAAPFNPYVEVVEALRRFDTQPAGRRMALLVSDGVDVSRGFRSASPFQSIDLDRAISSLQNCPILDRNLSRTSRSSSSSISAQTDPSTRMRSHIGRCSELIDGHKKAARNGKMTI
jgi:hypothetical protein